MFWRLFYKLRGVKGLNEAIDNRSIKDGANFLKIYLDRPFDSSSDEPFKIFDFLYSFVAEEKDYELCEKMMIGSKYFETMPLESSIQSLERFASITTWDCNTEKFSRYLISKITDAKILLNESLRTIANLYECYSGLGFEDKILEMGKDYIIELSYELDYSDSRKLLMKCREHFSKEEFVVLCQKGDFSTSDIFDLVLNNYLTSELDTLLDIVISKKERKNSIIDIRRKRNISVFEQFLDELNRRDEITEEHKNYLASKLLKSKNGPRMLDWLANIECESNKTLIDDLVGKASDFTILFNVSKKYVFYTLEKVLQGGNIVKFNFPTADTLFMDDYGDIEKLNLVIDGLFKLKPDVKFSKDLGIDFLKKGVNKFSVLINQYELTKEERLEIFQTLKEINSDWIIVYGVYLLGGDKAFDSVKGELIMNNIRARKKEEM